MHHINIPWIYRPALVERLEPSHGWVKRARAEGASYIWESRRKRSLARAPHLRSILQHPPRVSVQLTGITHTTSAVRGCLFKPRASPHTNTHTHWLRSAQTELLISGRSSWMLDPGAASARCPAITGYKWQIQVCVTSVRRTRGCMGDERSRQTSAWSARETRQPPGTNMGKKSSSNSTNMLTVRNRHLGAITDQVVLS